VAKKIRIVLTLQLPAGKATPAPPVGTALGPHGINIVEFTKAYNERTADKSGQVIPAQITIFEDRSFTFVLKTPPAPDLLRKAAGVDKGSATAKRAMVGRVTRDQVRQIAEIKLPDLNVNDIEAGMKVIEGTARSMGAIHEGQVEGPEEHPTWPNMASATRTRRSSSIAPGSTPWRRRLPSPGRRPPSSSTPPWRRTSASGLIPATPIRWSAARSCCRTAPARSSGSPCSPRQTRPGADEVGAEDLVKKIEAGWLEFDVALAAPDVMGMVGRLGRILGRRGLMPNPKSGTITFDLERAIREVKAGRVEFKVDKGAIIHVPVGKASFDESQLVDNLAALVDAVNRAKPSGAKGQYLRTLTIATTMGPGIRVDIPGVLAAASA
jgi:large subunit ribosomal protein L11